MSYCKDNVHLFAFSEKGFNLRFKYLLFVSITYMFWFFLSLVTEIQGDEDCSDVNPNFEHIVNEETEVGMGEKVLYLIYLYVSHLAQ